MQGAVVSSLRQGGGSSFNRETVGERGQGAVVSSLREGGGSSFNREAEK